MGWMASWIAVQVLEHLGLKERGGEVDPGTRAAPFSYKELPGGWLIVFSEAFEWADRKRLLGVSQFGLSLACQFEDKVEMASSLTAARDGNELWRVFHDSTGDSIYRLDVTGDAPAELADIRERLFAEQRENGGEDSPGDFIHDIPLDLGKAVCGYRADDEMGRFKALAKAGDGAQPGFFARLFGARRA